jgi:prephenate dehydrogenase
MQISVIGLGLIGGSLALALHGFYEAIILGYDINSDVRRRALEKGAIDISFDSMAECVREADITFFCSSPETILENIELCMPHFKARSLVSDICGLKRGIVELIGEHLREDLDYVGFHPMAGKEVGGFENAEIGLFTKAGFIIVPYEKSKKENIDLIYEAIVYIGAGRIVMNNATGHDEIIAYTSDLMHISACALVEEYPEEMNLAYTAGAYRDCTRIASIDADLWSQLLMRNAEHIVPHLSRLIGHLEAFKESLETGNHDSLHQLLETAGVNKAEILKK